MDYGFAACIPMLVLIVGALLTKRIAEMMILSTFIGAVMLYKGGFFSGYIDMIYNTLANPSYQFVLIILMGFGGLIRLFQYSGGLAGFRHFMEKFAKGPKKSLFIAWIMTLLMFVDDYLSILAVSFSMRDIADDNKIPREHLAYQVNSAASSFCVIIPFSSWTAFTIGLLSEQGLSFSDYTKALPFMFYPLLVLLLHLLLIFTGKPKVGLLKESYERVRSNGPTLVEETAGASIVDIEMPTEEKESSALHIILPVIVLVAFVLIYDNDLVHGIFAALAVQAVLYISQRIMTLTDFMNHFFEGAKSMVNLAIVICFSFTLSSVNESLGFLDYMVTSISKFIPASALLPLTFIIVGLAVFATSGYWTIQIIAIPIFIPLAISMEIAPHLVLAAMMSGVVFGCGFCLYSDTVFMAYAGTGVSNMRQLKTTLPYAMAIGGLSFIGYTVIGLLAT